MRSHKILIRLDEGYEGKVCGTFVSSETNGNPGRIKIKWIPEGSISAKTIEDRPEDALVEVPRNKYSGLESNSFYLLIADKEGSTPVLDYLRLSNENMAAKLSESRRKGDAMEATKRILEHQKSELESDIVKREAQKQKAGTERREHFRKHDDELFMR